MALRICYGCPYYLPSLYGAPMYDPPNRAYAYGGYSGTPGSIADGRTCRRMWLKPARVAGACRLGIRNIRPHPAIYAHALPYPIIRIWREWDGWI
jgi:hypothetical protein